MSAFATPSRSINLASRPFRKERAQSVFLFVACALLLCSLAVLSSFAIEAHLQASVLQGSIVAQKSALQKARAEQTRFLTVLSKPENEDVFAVSVLLNKLVARRAVSWTRVFKDLGTVLPKNIRLIGMRLPQIPSEDTGGVNHVQLDVLLGTEKPTAIIDLLKRLQASKVFGAAQVLAQQPPTQNDPLFKFRVTVAYDQKL